MKTPSLLFTGINTVELGSVVIPEPGAGEVWVGIDLSAISAGTELRVLRGEQDGQPPFPIIPGYTAIGLIIKVGSGVNVPLGTRVLSPTTARANIAKCWGGHCALHVRSASGLTLIPDDINDHDALMVRLAGIAYRGVRLARPRPDESVIVIGLGPIGQCSARLFHATGAYVLALDRSPERVALLQKQGVDARVVTGDLVEAGRVVFPDGADVVVDASGATAVALAAGELLRDVPWNADEIPGPRYVIQSSVPENISFHHHTLFSRETTVLFPRDSKPGDVEAVLSLLQRGRISLSDIISEVAAPQDAPSIYARLRQGKGDLLTAAFDWKLAR